MQYAGDSEINCECERCFIFSRNLSVCNWPLYGSEGMLCPFPTSSLLQFYMTSGEIFPHYRKVCGHAIRCIR